MPARAEISELERLAAEQAALRRVATLVAGGVGPEPVFGAVANEVQALFGTEIAAIVKFEDDGTVSVKGDRGGPHAAGARVQLDPDYIVAAVARTGCAARFDTDDPGAEGMPAFVREFGVRSGVASPIIVDGELWGAMTVTSREGSLPADTERRLADFTELVAMAVSSAQAQADVEQLAEEQAALRRVATLVARGVSPDELFSEVNDEVGRLFDSEASIARFEPDGSSVVIVAQTAGIPIVSIGTRWELDDLLATTQVYRTGRPARNDWTGLDTAAGPTAERLRKMNFTSTVAAPIVVEGGLWGVMTVSHPSERLPPDTEDRVERFTELVATAIANAQSRAELAASEARAHELAREQAALRRVATLVAESASADELFAAVAQEVAEVLDISVVMVQRFETDRTFTVMGIAGETHFTVGSRWPVEDEGVAGMILATGRPARKEGYAGMAGALGAAVRDDRMVARVGVPIIVEGGTWGFMVAATRPGKPIPPDVESRLKRFTELLATAIANADSQAALAASRARIIAANVDARRRVVRDLHDGAQQRLVHSIITLKLALRALREKDGEAKSLVDEALEQTEQANVELRELAHGILPSVLTRGGLQAGVETVVSRLDLPVQVDIANERVPAEIEASAYFIIAEALTNVVKHAHATRAEVKTCIEKGTLLVEVRDDGVGGADPTGHGLIGLADRTTALGGSLQVQGMGAGGTLVVAVLPLPAPDDAEPLRRGAAATARAPRP